MFAQFLFLYKTRGNVLNQKENVLVNLTQLVGTTYNICKVHGSIPDHQKKILTNTMKARREIRSHYNEKIQTNHHISKSNKNISEDQRQNHYVGKNIYFPPWIQICIYHVVTGLLGKTQGSNQIDKTSEKNI